MMLTYFILRKHTVSACRVIPGITVFMILALCPQLHAQVKPSGTNSPESATPVTAPGAYSNGAGINYVRTREAVAPITSTSVFDTSGISKVKQVTQYIDGLGRVIQSVAKQASPSAKDMVSPVLFDKYGREEYRYLAYTDTGVYGGFKLNAFSQQASFMSGLFPDESVYYKKTEYESSPLNRVSKVMDAGNSWSGSGRGITTQYLVNEANDSVRIWTIGYDTLTYSGGDAGTNIPTTAAMYPAGTLYETHTIDEDGNQVVEYKDKQARVILKKVQAISSPSAGHTGWLCTYYVYDDVGLLRFVISPKATGYLLANSWTFSSDVTQELCFRYEYDGRNRMIAKKVPGAGWVYMVYDRRDRLVFTQDANMRAGNKWMANLYDGLNRPVSTGMIDYSGNRGALQWLLNSQYDAASATTIAINFDAPDSLYVSTRDTGKSTYRAVNQIVFTGEFTSEDNAEFETVLGAAVVSTTNVLQDYNPFPPSHNFVPLTVNYYDDYTFTSKVYNSTYNSQIDDGGNANAETLPGSQSLLTRGLATGSKVRALEDPGNLSAGIWMESAVFYDDKGRVIQSQSENYKNGTDLLTTRYSFTGKAVTTYQVHENAVAGQTLRTKTNLLYDPAERLQWIKKTINDNSATTRFIERDLYNEMGQLAQRRIGQVSGSDTSALEVQDNTYTIRGWLQGINREYSRGTGTRWFGMELNYDWGFTANNFNGNIAGQQWRSRGDGERRSYGYAYDPSNRISSADFTQYNSGSAAWNTSAGLNFTLSSMGYDANGNILSLQQQGWKPGGSTTIDNLAYTYQSNSNKLGNVSDAVTTDNKLGDFTDGNTSGDDYSYDDNGNLAQDKNKSIASITYNHLNLPYLVTVTGKGTIRYIYDAAGNKLEKRTVETSPSKTTVTDYLGAYVYNNDTLQFFSHEGGRVRAKQDGSYVYDYFLKDHLGNTRVVLTDEQQTDAYPAVTLESNSLGVDTLYYSVNAANIVSNPASLPATYQNNNGNPPYNPNPNINPTATSANMYKLNGATGDKIGLGIALKVMAGDQVAIFGKSFWHSNGSNPNNNYTTVVNDLITSFAGTASVAGAGKGITGSALIGSGVTPTDISNLLASEPGATGRPNAYINWILFDEQFRVVSGNSGFDAVNTASDNLKSHTQSVSVSKSGYLYVYVSNESDQDVYFDNLQVIHTRGPLLEETHYYPFGLTMAGISSKAAGRLENKKKFVGQELDDELGLNWYQFRYRNHDPQIGRFVQIDPLALEYVHNSTYAYSENRPINGIDLEGLEYFQVNTSSAMSIASLAGSKQHSDAQIKEYAKGEFQDQLKNGLNRAKMVGYAGIGLANSQIGIPLVLTELTGAPVLPSPQALAGEVGAIIQTEGSLTEMAAELKPVSTIRQNAARGATFEEEGIAGLNELGNTNIVKQVSVKAANGVTVRADALSINVTGDITMTEFKSSITAPLTKNQKVAFPSIAKEGGIVVGKGKPPFVGGTIIPPTEVNIIRPTQKNQ